MLGKNTSIRIISKVESITENPFAFVKKLHGVSLYSLRTGNYRTILDIENKRLVIFVVRIGHRSRIYADF